MSINTDMKKCILLQKETTENSLGQDISTYKQIGTLDMAIYKNKPRVNNRAEVGIQDIVRNEFTGITSYLGIKKGMRIKSDSNETFDVEDVSKGRKIQVALKEVLING